MLGWRPSRTPIPTVPQDEKAITIMTLAVGTVSIDSTGHATGSGLSLALANAMLAKTDGARPDYANPVNVDARETLAKTCAAQASAIINYLVTNTVVSGSSIT
jgi:hypothetical protein